MNNFNAIQTNSTDVIQDIYAARRFILEQTPSGLQLTGLTFKQPIVDGINIAACGAFDHEAPLAECTCGFYAYDDQESQFGIGIDAVVKLSGRIIVCHSGVRAERLEIVAIASPSEEIRDGLTEVTSAPIFDSREKMYAKFPVSKLKRPERTLKNDFKNRAKAEVQKVGSYFKNNWKRLVVKAAKWAFIVAGLIFLLRFEASMLPTGAKEHAILTVAVMAALAFAAVRAPLVLVALFYVGISVSSVSIANHFVEEIKSLGLDKFIVINYSAFVAFGFIVIIGRMCYWFEPRKNIAPVGNLRPFRMTSLPIRTLNNNNSKG